jgi:hypothetical protein
MNSDFELTANAMPTHQGASAIQRFGEPKPDHSWICRYPGATGACEVLACVGWNAWDQ